MVLRSDDPLIPERQLRVFSVLARRGAVDVLQVLLTDPHREFTVRELAEAAGVPPMSASRIVSDLHGLRVVRRRKVGRAYAVSLEGESPATGLVRRLFTLCRYE